MADGIEVAFDGAREWLAKLTEAVAKADDLSGEAIRKAAHLVETAAKKRASGRPGPNVITGTLRRSIGVHDGPTRTGLGQWEAGVGPTAVYARRVELGFDGSDSAGRQFRTPGYPYLGPGLEDARPAIEAIFADAYRHLF